ncbi:hypothetical protein BO83DRAFT_395474 [Aspergillus eucalypticola CBS 122712]|uniref:Xylanolytic transcriptional activator regulatory domain-containing protein n=1 Tax=Aspergillus eucalypticola (strain CBS 122712 / IBT 29274) TaxID=1448314 RepID=A0A317WAH5_ASPEC|nr:uncharacterized protein BO83DRAFT_395474 [Aspergillus eucalypticola CBS 122712]PWY82332.1 hypothetical protein BO83DRAFT_395474 [Aspergillus eucalypticola CBS 122712]
MANRTRLKSETQKLRACVECRVANTVLTCSKRRKSKFTAKCSGTAPCSYCSWTQKRCRFERVPSRTPLTRKNLEEKEQLCEKLMTLVRNLGPNIDIEEALKELAGAGQGHDTNETDHNSLLGVSPGAKSPTPLENFEWNEGPMTSSHPPNKSLYGMASLPTEGSGSGYLDKWLEDLFMNEIDGHPANSTKLASPHILRELDNSILTDSQLDAYSGWYNRSFPILHEQTFREKYQNRHHTPPHSTWHLICYIVLAIGDWVISGGSKVEESRYYMAARLSMSISLLESGAHLTVQAESTHDTLSSERRRVVWWIVYSFDSGFSLTTGRPLMLSDCFIETELPRNIEDSVTDFKLNQRDQNLPLDSIAPLPIDKPTTYSAIIAQARLSRIGNTVFCNMIAGPKKDLDTKTPRSLDHQLKAWRLSVPLYFTAHDVPTCQLKEQNLRMMLWWGTQRICGSPSDSEEARNMCHYAALWIFSIERSRDCLANLSQKNQAAARCLEVLDRIMYQSQATPTAYNNTGMRLDTLAVDPSLQMLFDATPLDMYVFEGLEGFPNTNEVESSCASKGRGIYITDIAAETSRSQLQKTQSQVRITNVISCTCYLTVMQVLGI